MSAHRCTACGWKHNKPKALNAIRTIALSIIFATVEALAALSLDGTLSVLLWLVAAWNVFVLAFLIVGLANLAVENGVES